MTPVSDPSENNARDLTLFVACYDEEDNIVPTLQTVLAAVAQAGCSADIVVVDDGSKDKSVERVRQFMNEHPDAPVSLVVNHVNQGVGVNFVEAAFRGRGKYFRMICGDDTENKDTIVGVLRHLGEADMILTYHSDASARSRSRRVISRAFTFWVNVIGGHRIRYYNGLAVHLRYNVMRWHPNSHGFGFQADLITRMLDMGATYVEVPVVPMERPSGVTKAFRLRNICSVVHTLFELFVRRVGRAIYPRYVGSVHHYSTVYSTPGFERINTR